jgi:hypothetical protein
MTEDYVTNDAWLANPSRDETIDEIADQFERRHEGAAAFWDDVRGRRATEDRYSVRMAG